MRNVARLCFLGIKKKHGFHCSQSDISGFRLLSTAALEAFRDCLETTWPHKGPSRSSPGPTRGTSGHFLGSRGPCQGSVAASQRRSRGSLALTWSARGFLAHLFGRSFVCSLVCSRHGNRLAIQSNLVGVYWTPCGLGLLGLLRLVQVEAWSSLVGVKQVLQGWRPLPRACKTCAIESLVGTSSSLGLEAPPGVSKTCQSENLE